jgi:hypothetical protein
MIFLGKTSSSILMNGESKAIHKQKKGYKINKRIEVEVLKFKC